MENKSRKILCIDLEEARLPKYIPSPGDRLKHMPTEQEETWQTDDLKHYDAQCSSAIKKYDFSRGWEFGFGTALLVMESRIKSAGVEVDEEMLENGKILIMVYDKKTMEYIRPSIQDFISMIKGEKE